jgi:hypothetical protein
MTGPRPAGRRWTLTDDDMLRKLLTSGMEQRLIAQKLKRSIGAIQNLPFQKVPEATREGSACRAGAEGENEMIRSLFDLTPELSNDTLTIMIRFPTKVRNARVLMQKHDEKDKRP